MTAVLLLVLTSLCAFAVDVGQWYLVGQQEQRAVDSAAMAGVTSLPGNAVGAHALAQAYTKINGFDDADASTTVTSAVDGHTTRLRVTVTKTVENFFGSLMGMPTTKVTRSAVADYTGPVPMASPCNEFGNDPDPGTNKSTNCANTGSFWANVGSKGAQKGKGDAHQNDNCSGTTLPNLCTSAATSGANTDYDANGYFYVVTVSAPVASLTIQAYDPAQIITGSTSGDLCPSGGTARLEEAAGIGGVAPVSNPSVRYVTGAGVWCTGDTQQSGGIGDGLIKTQFTVRSPGGNAWDPANWTIQPSCGATNPRTFNGYNTRLRDALSSDRSPIAEVRETFRRWVTLCTIAGPVQPGTYAIQVKTNGLGADAKSGHNRFSLRAYGSDVTDKDVISVAAFNKMAMYGNTPAGISRFFLAKVPSGAKGQLFNIRLFDIGEGSSGTSTLKVLPPSENGVGATFANCTGSGVVNGPLTDCTIAVSTAFESKWQTISVPIPASYTCNDAAYTGCWVRLEFNYGANSSPRDTTTWAASIDGDPVRLVE